MLDASVGVGTGLGPAIGWVVLFEVGVGVGEEATFLNVSLVDWFGGEE